jgi:PAS domain S-box-containing protein
MGKEDERGKAEFIDRKQIEGALDESENKYRSLFENVQDVFFETNLEGIILEISPSIKYFSDFDKEELLGTSIFDIYCNPEDRTVLLNTITLHGEIRDYELKLKTKNGQIKVVSVNARLTMGPDGQPDRIDGAVRDISERKLVEEALSESEAKYRFLFANNPQPMWIYDLETLAFLEVNQAAINHYGYSKEEFLSMTIRDIRPAEDIPALVNHLGLTRSILNQAGKWRHIKKNGEIIYVEIASHLVQFNGRNARHVLIHDITGRKQAEDALKKSEQKYRNLHESMIDGFAYIDLLGFIKDYNESFKQLLGYSDEELSLLTYRDFTPEKWHNFEQRIIAEQVLTRGFSDIYEKEYRKKDGTVFPVEIHTFLMKNDAGENEGMWAIVRDITGRKRAEEALLESHQQLLDIIDFLPDATFVVDNEKKVIAWNKAIEEMTGVQKQDMIGKGDHAYAVPFYGRQQNVFLDFIDNNDKELNARYSNVSKKGLSSQAEIFAPNLYNGKGAYISILGAPLFNAHGERMGSIESVRDITDRKLAEEQLKLSNQRIALHIQHTPLAFIEFDFEGRVRGWNPAAVKIFGFSQEEAIGQYWTFIVPQEAWSSVDGVWDALVKQRGGSRSSNENITRNGQKISCEWYNTPLIDQDGKTLGVASLVMDITDRKRAEEALVKLKKAIYNSGEAIFLTDREGIFSFVNPSFTTLYGFSSDEIVGKTTPRIIKSGVSDKSVYDYFWQTLLNGDEVKGELINKRKDGTLVNIDGSATPIIDEEKNIIGFLGIQRDITERKKAEQELLFAKEKAEESNRLKTAFLNNISHEIRTPFNGILGFLSIIQDFDLTGTERDEYISVINKSADRLINTINDIVEMSQIQTGQMKLTASETNIKMLTDDLSNKFKTVAESLGLVYTLNNDLPIDMVSIPTDSTKLNTILSILIGNAIKFTKAGSIQIGIKLKAASGYVEPAEKVSETVELEFSVKDTGIGIPKDRQEAIFERFLQADFSNTRQFEGAGLGLSIAKAYVEMLGGKIWVESNPEGKSGEKGSTFYFTVPYNAKPDEQTSTENVISIDSSSNPIDPEAPGLKILIAEDDELSELFLRRAIKSFSKEILHVRTGVEAVEVCRNNPDIDLILMDIKMPDSNGHDAAIRIRQFNDKVVIIAQTAFSLSGDREKARAAGCNDYIVKPVRKEQLLELIQKYFQ